MVEMSKYDVLLEIAKHRRTCRSFSDEPVQIAVFSGQQGRILRPVRVIFDGQSFSVV